MLRGIVRTNNLPWVVISDFNEVLHANEHEGVGQRSQAQMDAFRNVLDTCGLSDIGYKGLDWTWEKKVAGGTFTRVRLDRCVATPEWMLAFPAATLEHKLAASSDHIPILLHLTIVHACKRGLRPFKYEVAWERNESLAAVIGSAWARTPGDSVSTIRDKLQLLLGDLSTRD